jgi:ubiquinone/menaquinone biosynthesis C-methylase UbiE
MSTGYAEFNDQRLAEIYDFFCPLSKDSDFILKEVKKQTPATILDVGCGSGILTVELAKIAKNVIGVEPARPMLDIARRRPGGEKVRWVEGFTTDVNDVRIDAAIMTSHVAQFFLEDDEWKSTLGHLYKVLNPGGRIIFDSKNPLVKMWQSWNKENTSETVDTPNGKVMMWNELVSVKQNLVNYELHYQFDSGDQLVSENELIYRSKDEITNALKGAGFEVERIYGDWDGSTADDSSEELIFIARKV